MQKTGGPSLGQIIQNGQRPLWFSCRMPSLSAHAVLHTPDSCHLPLDSICGQTQHHQQNQPSVGSPCTTSLSREGALDPLGRPTLQGLPPQRPHRPWASSCPGLAPRRLTGQTQLEPHDNKGHQKEKKQSHTPVAVCREGTRPCRVPSQPSTHGHSDRVTRESSAETPGPPLAPPLAPQRPGARSHSAEGWEGKTRLHIPSKTQTGLPSQRAERRAGSWSQQRSVQHPQEECFQALLFPRTCIFDTAWSCGPFCPAHRQLIPSP